MNRIILSGALAALLAAPAFASDDDLVLDDAMRTRITEQLTAEGYEVGKIKIEDGEYEAYAKKDGHRYEVFLDADLNVTHTKDD
ncbi:hypothetical protein GGQ68_001767 [Sagittula marina]|uniref:PepSY domain-containing protein n=1 Tax=Sagittula marina TaxID=943940 RepID=A0A7W6DMR1_9RHOB|nr:PepSY domain-containing protein [Sagittula marina]MBB3985434.1 hypothetical protein [Sagittula marina]